MRWKRKINHGGSSQQQQVGATLADEACAIDEEVSHLSRIKSEPSQRTRASICAGQKRPISTFKLLSGRESNCSGMGRFSSADCSYALRKHLPVKGPWCVDDMDSEAYISQFSADGSLLIGGFRGSHIRVYNSERNWKVHKDITCKRLRWTVSDIALSPDQRFLAYSSLSPTIPICIRCYFSPMHSTGQRYIYTGSSDQCVYIYDVATGNVVDKLRWHGSIIRDCSWHPYLPTLVSSSWDGYLVRWEATDDDRDPSMLKTGKQRMHPEGYTMSFVL